jgi:hypothetical protein
MPYISNLKSTITSSIVFVFYWIIALFQLILGSILLFFSSIREVLYHIYETVISTYENKDGLLKYGLFLLAIIGLTITLNFASDDPTALTSSISKYMYPITAVILGTLAYVFISSFVGINLKFIIMVFSTLALIFGSVLYYFSSTTPLSATLLYIMSGIVTFASIIGLAIVFYFYSNYIKSIEGWGGFFAHLLFYIPCLVIDFINYIKSEIGMTTNVVYYLFLLEIVAALLYIYIPKIVNKVAASEGTPLLAESAFLDIKKELESGYNLAFKNIGYSDSAVTTYRRAYSISMWLYLNLQPPNYTAYAKETEIFNYGNGLPKVTYINNVDTDGSKTPDMLKVYFTNAGDNADRSYTLSIKSQKWNQIVFNYNSSHVDLFVNGFLEKTFVFSGNEPNYTATDIISTGSVGGLDGAICNIKYHIAPQSKGQIATSYNLLMKQNPPVNIL